MIRFRLQQQTVPARSRRFPFIEFVLVLASMVVLAVVLGAFIGAQP